MSEEKEQPQLDDESFADEHPNIDRVLDMYVTVHVNIGHENMNFDDILGIVPGSILEFHKKVDEPLDLSINNLKTVAKGEIVTIGENLGMRILETF